MSERELKAGDRFTITRIVQPDYDSYAVIHLSSGGAFGCGKDWFDAEHPRVGAVVVFQADGHFHTEAQSGV